MKIIYHHRTRAEDAQGIHIKEIIKAFRKLGHKVTEVGIISSENNAKAENSSLISKAAALAPPLIFELMEIAYNFVGFSRLRKKIINFKPDFIYERYALYMIAGVIVSKLYKIPLIVEVNAPLSYEKKKYSDLILHKVAKWAEKFICSNSYKTITVSTYLKKMLIDIGVPEHKILVIPNGVNQDYFNPLVDKNQIRKKYGLEGKKILGFVGWFREWHGLEELLLMYAEKKMFQHGIHLLLVGDGPIYNTLVNIAREQNILTDGVTFTGPIPRDEIPLYIASFDLALQPDVTDYASPIKLFEYIGMGKGVIAPKKENIKEILSDDYSGYFQPGNWEDMGETIIKSAISFENIDRLSQQAYKVFFDRQYLWINNARKTIELVKI